MQSYSSQGRGPSGPAWNAKQRDVDQAHIEFCASGSGLRSANYQSEGRRSSNGIRRLGYHSIGRGKTSGAEKRLVRRSRPIRLVWLESDHS